MAIKTLYIIVDNDGNIKARRRAKNGTGSCYTEKAEAIRQAKADGDAVVPVVWDTGRQPIHVRHKKVDPNKDPGTANGSG